MIELQPEETLFPLLGELTEGVDLRDGQYFHNLVIENIWS